MIRDETIENTTRRMAFRIEISPIIVEMRREYSNNINITRRLRGCSRGSARGRRG